MAAQLRWNRRLSARPGACGAYAFVPRGPLPRPRRAAIGPSRWAPNSSRRRRWFRCHPSRTRSGAPRRRTWCRPRPLPLLMPLQQIGVAAPIVSGLNNALTPLVDAG
ncbi:PE-PPE domain-containing protein [Mycobacterium servetii]|uniref:PE-PPE domain-containing protein n=1 Tax=Mycobacterium servetii TaxID=3237418 RepID=A0ABV4C4T6_9MYCO